MSEEKVTVEELKKKAELPGKKAIKWHPFYKGKVEVMPKCQITSVDDFGIWYTPGVAKPCEEIDEDPAKAYDHTNKGNSIAVVSDGTRVLGLGDIGPLAGMPVMEGKGLLFKYLGGVDATPLMVDTKDADELIETVKRVSPTYGGINLEDISSPKCFYVLDTLREELDIPVWHDDQQGTAAVTLAGVLNGLKIVGKDLEDVSFSIIGVGAANICLIRTLLKAGANPDKIYPCDSSGILHEGREDMEELQDANPYKYEIAQKTNAEGRTGGIAEALKGTDVCIAASKPGPGTIKKEWAAGMNDGAIMFAEANPVPEIWPWEAKDAGIEIFGTGRSDFENQVNNSLGFPGIFRGTLDVRATTITDQMHIAAAEAIAEVAAKKGLKEDYIVPTMEDWEVFPYEAAEVAMTAIEQGVARKELSRDEVYDKARKIIKDARDKTQLFMDNDFIKEAPKVE